MPATSGSSSSGSGVGVRFGFGVLVGSSSDCFSWRIGRLGSRGDCSAGDCVTHDGCDIGSCVIAAGADSQFTPERDCFSSANPDLVFAARRGDFDIAGRDENQDRILELVDACPLAAGDIVPDQIEVVVTGEHFERTTGVNQVAAGSFLCDVTINQFEGVGGPFAVVQAGPGLV